MKHLTHLMLALAAGAAAFPAFAIDTHVALSADAAAAHAKTATAIAALHASARRAVRPARATPAGVAVPAAMGTNTYPGTPMANPLRAYPPSCAAWPLPDEASGDPVSSQRVTLYAQDTSTNPYTPTTETVTVTVWRLACSSSGTPTPYNPAGAANAMTLMRIDRDPGNDGTTTVFPTFPAVEASQNGSALSLVRNAVDPNTVESDTPYDSPVVSSTTYVLENYPYVGAGYFTFSDAFTLSVDPGIQGVSPFQFNVTAYNPSPSTYPDAFNPLPIDGYLGTSWYDPTHSGEGMLAQVIDNADGTTRTFFASWYTYDPLGLPFWITAQGTFPIGAVSVNTTGYYQTGGGFAGNFGSATTQHVWGSLSFSFPNCDTMQFSYTGQTDAQTNGPAGSGNRTWRRVADNNGLTCE